MILSPRVFLFAAASSLALLAGCAVGPDFERPPAPAVTGYEAEALPEKTAASDAEGGAAQSLKMGADVPGEWWSMFHSEPLDDLVAAALKANPDLTAAQANLQEARENLYAGAGGLFPSIDANAGVSREKISSIAFGGTSAIPPFTLYNATVSVNYGLDLWGGLRRQIEALGADVDYQRFQLEAAYLSLTGNVVTAAISEASLRKQIEVTRQLIDIEQKQLAIIKKQFELGGAAKSAVLAQDALLAQAKATLPPLEQQLAAARHELSALAGQFPSEEPAGRFELAALKLPEDIPVSLPSKLVDQRPDLRAAEAQLHAASAQIGVATANMLPQITITGDLGGEAGNIGKFFTPGTGIWDIGAGLTQPLFHGGTLLHERKAAEDAYTAAAAQYRKTVLTAFQNVADSLRALQSDAEALKANAAAAKAASDSLALSQEQYKDGAITYVGLLGAEQTELQANLALVQAEARRFADTAALFQALGGGWWNRTDVKDDSPPPKEEAVPATTNVNQSSENKTPEEASPEGKQAPEHFPGNTSASINTGRIAEEDINP